MALLNLALAAEALFGPGFLKSVGREGGDADQERFRRFVMGRLSRLLMGADREA